MDDQILTKKQIAEILHNSVIRKELAYNSIYYFFAIYFFHYIKFPLAPFHKDFFKLAENKSTKLAVISAFRGSAKSTIFSLCYPIWAATGKQQKKFILIITYTQQQAKMILDNLKKELEENILLKRDIGPFIEESGEWSSTSIVLKRYNVRIRVASVEEGIRGVRYGQYRPDVIILDDVEDLPSIKTQEGRDKLFDWYTGNIIPLGDIHTRIILIGTRLHEDDLLSRIIEKIKTRQMKGIYKEIPLLNSKRKIAWLGKYPTMNTIIKEEMRVGNNIAWCREFLLKFVSSEDQLIKNNFIQYYDIMPPLEKLSYIIIGVDLAISQKETADYTAMVPLYVFKTTDSIQIYVGKQIVNKRLNLYQTGVIAKELQYSIANGQSITLVVEDIGYQKAALEHMKKEGLKIEAVTIYGQDKYTRLSMTTPYFEQGIIFFPKEGVKELISQLTGFPSEAHDDMVDALVYGILKIQELENRPKPSIRWL